MRSIFRRLSAALGILAIGSVLSMLAEVLAEYPSRAGLHKVMNQAAERGLAATLERKPCSREVMKSVLAPAAEGASSPRRNAAWGLRLSLNQSLHGGVRRCVLASRDDGRFAKSAR